MKVKRLKPSASVSRRTRRPMGSRAASSAKAASEAWLAAARRPQLTASDRGLRFGLLT
jgi:hypothetical protein